MKPPNYSKHYASEEIKTITKLNFFKKLIPVKLILFLLLTLFLIYSFFYFDYSVATWRFRIGYDECGQLGFVNGSKSNEECNYFDGKWVWDETYPLYDSKDCSFSDGGFKCLKNNRPDDSFTKWRWQPNQCNLPRLFIFLYPYVFYLFCCL